MKLLTIAYYELKRLIRDYRLIIIIISQPIVIALIVGLLSYQDPKDIQIGLIDKNPNNYSNQISQELKENDKFQIKEYSKVDDEEIKNGRIRAFVILDIDDVNVPRGQIEILNDPAGETIKFFVEGGVAKAVADTNEKIEAINISTNDLTPFKIKHFDYFASAMMVLLILLVVINLSSISITSERIQGTFERLFVTPYTKFDVIFGKALAQFGIGIFVAFVGTLSLYLMFGINIGNIGLIILINALAVATSVTLGLFISSITYTVVESVELAMYAFFISVLTTGIIAPMETAYKYFPYAMKINPFYYAVDASRRINMANASWPDISTNIYILAAFLLCFLMLSILLLRREAK